MTEQEVQAKIAQIDTANQEQRVAGYKELIGQILD
jgi:hypothetical protein